MNNQTFFSLNLYPQHPLLDKRLPIETNSKRRHTRRSIPSHHPLKSKAISTFQSSQKCAFFSLFLSLSSSPPGHPDLPLSPQKNSEFLGIFATDHLRASTLPVIASRYPSIRLLTASFPFAPIFFVTQSAWILGELLSWVMAGSARPH